MAPRSSSLSDDGDSAILSATPTPFSHLHRTMSHNSQWSASDTPQHHNQGTSYASQSSQQPRPSPAPILVRSSSIHSMRRGTRSRSISSASRGLRDDDALSEEDEDDEDDEHIGTRGKGIAADGHHESDDDADAPSDREEDPITLKDRQSLINVEHPFGLPIWKPALYKKSRSVTRHADEALHSVPSAQAERHLLPGNIFWVVFFGWWLGLTCFTVSIILHIIPRGGKRYSSLVFGLGWYLAWPFGKYVEGDTADLGNGHTVDSDSHGRQDSGSTVRGEESDAGATVRGVPFSEHPIITQADFNLQHTQAASWNSNPEEGTSLLPPQNKSPKPAKSYGATSLPSSVGSSATTVVITEGTVASDILGEIAFWLFIVCIIAPLMLFVCLICWALVVTIPMAKLNWALLKHLFERPTSLRFCSAPPAVVVATQADHLSNSEDPSTAPLSIKPQRISPGQTAPSGTASSKVLLCTYRAVGLQYYKYTVGGVNIMFVNLMPVVFFVIFDGLVLMEIVDEHQKEGKHVPIFLTVIASKALIFLLSLLSVIPLSYFIGMAVASISAQSSIGMGAVINATFGSIIEIVLYSIALTQSKGRLVEGSIVGSLLAGVLLMPGMSMVSSALRRKEQKFNAKSASVTSMMLIMAIIGILTPTLFYQTYGNFQLVCSGCPSAPGLGSTNKPWVCDKCYYEHPDPVDDPFYQSTVKSFMFFCAVILLLSYLIGLWFSLRTHASQIWQNPQQLLHPIELPIHNRHSLYQRLLPSGGHSTQRPPPLYHKTSTATNIGGAPSSVPPTPREASHQSQPSGSAAKSSAANRRVSYATGPPPPAGFFPVMESVDHAVKNTAGLQVPEAMTTDEFTRAVAVATVSALRHQQTHAHSPARVRSGAGESEADGHGGHDAPSWSRTTSASVLLACTALYAIIAEILVDVVDVVLEGSGIDEKFLGITVFALVPNTTEFMNAISFALNGNIALSMEIGSAYALQVCLLQIPAMVAFSAWYAPEKLGEVATTFTLIFPRWDVVVIILSMFLMTYTYIEAKSNYHRGSILILSYLVLAAGYYFAPHGDASTENDLTASLQSFTNSSVLHHVLGYLTSWLR